MTADKKGLSVSFEDKGACCVVVLVGDLNMFTAPELRVQLVEKLDLGVRRFLFDLQKLSYIDSSGIGVLVSFMNMARSKDGGKIVLCGLNQQIRSIFQVTRLLSVFIVAEDMPAGEREIAS